ncbi:Bax inhibitor-1/YccA family protein [Staphylococcus xylosus]|uniref:Bax inhibitor-1/YccA family protein n=1 Tax=Staphylococcus xylosus TaxID=1288 RepID=A0A939NG57_STAXY|nr:Bax inhibitor-1/YccA family protein [Staphylococcus xylosus]
MAESTQHVNKQQKQSKTNLNHNRMHIVKYGYSLCITGLFWYWLLFWTILTMEWRKPLSFVLLALVLITVIFNRARKYGIVISHIYAIVVGLLSYATFTAYLQNLGRKFSSKYHLAISAFIVFGIIGYFLIGNAASMGKYLFVTLVALIIASLIGMFIQNPIFHTIITVVGLLLFLLYTLYDFNRMKRGQFSQEKWALIYL